MNKILPVVGTLAKCAMVCSALLLLSNLRFASPRANYAWLSSLPLALAGIAYALLQIRLRPNLHTLLKRLLLAASFIFWAIDQLLPSGPAATFIGDAVVSIYVLDLFWIIQEQKAEGAHSPIKSDNILPSITGGRIYALCSADDGRPETRGGGRSESRKVS
jgi:hypothetical protein